MSTLRVSFFTLIQRLHVGTDVFVVKTRNNIYLLYKYLLD